MSVAGIDNITDPAVEQVDELQGRIADLAARLEHAERLATLGTIAGLIAHEFNNILTPVMSYAQLALANCEDPDLARKALQKAADGADQASQIAAAILGFVRTEQGGEARADVREAVETALACIGRDLEKDRIEVDIDVPRGTCAAMAPVALRHILVNLILNARNAMLPRGGALAIRANNQPTVPAPPESAAVSMGAAQGVGGMEHSGDTLRFDRANEQSCGGYVVLTVRDTGHGIELDRLERIFDPFETTRSEKRHPDQVGGTGLGLVTCVRLATESGGAMWAESEVGRGTAMTVALPVAAAEECASATPARLVA